MWLRINAVVWLDYCLIIEKNREVNFIYPPAASPGRYGPLLKNEFFLNEYSGF